MPMFQSRGVYAALALAAGQLGALAQTPSSTGAPTSVPTTSMPAATALPVDLGTAGNYVILAKSGVDTKATSGVTGDIGVSPIKGAAMTGFSETLDSKGAFATSPQVTGSMYASDYKGTTPSVLTTAVSDMETAYTDAAGRPLSGFGDRLNLGGSSGIGGKTLTPGVYKWDVDVIVETEIYFDAAGDDQAVFILQTSGNVVVAANVNVVLQNGAQAKHIFWQVAGYVQVGAGANAAGVFLVKTKADFITGSKLDGRVLAQTAVNLQQATITEPNISRRLQAAPTPTVELLTAGNFAILAKAGVSTVPASSVTGDVGVSPISGAALTGFSTTADSSGEFATSGQVDGKLYAANFFPPTPSKLTTAVSNMEAAYTDAAGRTNLDAARINLGSGNLGGAFGGETTPLTTGVYTWQFDITFAGDVHISGSADDVFILQTTGNVYATNDIKIILKNGAQAKNIFWQVAGFVEAGVGAHLEGIFLVKTHAEFFTGSSLYGRVLAQTAVTLQKTVIAQPTTKRRLLRGGQ